MNEQSVHDRAHVLEGLTLAHEARGEARLRGLRTHDVRLSELERA